MCAYMYLCVCRGAAFCPVLCRRGAIAECPSMTLRAVGQSSVLCWAVCPRCWRCCTDRHFTVTWLMYMAGFPHRCSAIMSSPCGAHRNQLWVSVLKQVLAILKNLADTQVKVMAGKKNSLLWSVPFSCWHLWDVQVPARKSHLLILY